MDWAAADRNPNPAVGRSGVSGTVGCTPHRRDLAAPKLFAQGRRKPVPEPRFTVLALHAIPDRAAWRQFQNVPAIHLHLARMRRSTRSIEVGSSPFRISPNSWITAVSPGPRKASP